MKLLYISSWHTTQEFDDLTLFTELGINWFSTGIYLDPLNPAKYSGVALRGPINKVIDRELVDQFTLINPYRKFFKYPILTKEFIKNFDLVMCNFSYMFPNAIEELTKYVGNSIPIIYRTYGHQSESIELMLTKLKKDNKISLVRNSPTESRINGYAGEDAIIRGYADENIYNNWNGTVKSSLTFANDFNARLCHSNYECYRVYLRDIKPYIKNSLYGHGNSSIDNNTPVSHIDQLELYRSHAAYLSLNSPPANFPYSFIEALMAGIPIVTIGPKLGNAPGMSSYEVPSILTHGTNGFYSDKSDEIKIILNTLIHSPDLGKKIGEEGRKLAITLFSKEKIKNQWKDLFKLFI